MFFSLLEITLVLFYAGLFNVSSCVHVKIFFFKKLKADLIADLIARIISAVLEDLLNFTGILEVH